MCIGGAGGRVRGRESKREGGREGKGSQGKGAGRMLEHALRS